MRPASVIAVQKGDVLLGAIRYNSTIKFKFEFKPSDAIRVKRIGTEQRRIVMDKEGSFTE